jgi:alpha-L-fucosidase
MRFNDDRDWFFEKRFGMFIHWGLYAIPAWHEQIVWRLPMDMAEYAKLVSRFNPTAFDPDAWLDLAGEAGMSFLAFTTKHHDGFCLWNTRQTDFNVMRTPYARDITGMLAETCRRRSVPFCPYYSVIDWHHSNYPNANRSHELPGPKPGDNPDLPRYLDFMKAQAEELCTNYGKLHGFWWDMDVIGIQDPSVNALIRRLQPGILINNRAFGEGDFGTPEREYEDLGAVRAFQKPTQCVQAVGMESWGYREDEDYYTDAHLIRAIDAALARGGSYLLNVSPRADGTIPDEHAAILRRIGRWYKAVEEAFIGAEPASHLTENTDVLLTRKDNTLYVHLHKPPMGNRVSLKLLAALPRRATLLNTGEPVEVRVDRLPSQFTDPGSYLRLRNLPVNELPNEALVVKMEFDALEG